MADESTFKKFWNRITGWQKDPANHYLYVQLPKDRTDADYDDGALVQHRNYFPLWLCEMFLTNRREWFTTWFPAVHASVQLNFAGQNAVTFSHVTQPEKAKIEGVLLNHKLTELMPFNGGNVNIDAELLAVKGKDYLDLAINLLQDFSGLITAPLGEVLEVAEKVSKGIGTLMGKGDNEVHLAFHQSFVSAGGGGGADLKPGYIAVILGTEAQIDKDLLRVKADRLYYGPQQPFRGYDYMLFRIEGRKERDDWRLKNIEDPLNKAIEATLKGESENAKGYKMIALTTALTSPDLALYDRRRVVQAIKDELAEIEQAGAGAVGEEVRDLTQIVGARAMPIDAAVAKGPMKFDELFD